MRLKHLELHGFKSFGKRVALDFAHNITAVVGPNGSGKSNVVEAFRFVLGEQSIKSMRGKSGTDLIFKGSKNLPKGTVAKVVLEFDNQDNVFKVMNDAGEYTSLHYDSISIGREVFADGLNKYTLAGSDVRLKDINSLLSSVHIGSSGHHIISQGEADRVLNANPRELREIVEDALGLKLYQYKIKEAGRKLERALANMQEVSIEKRENTPHLNFLRKQVEKFEKAHELKQELLALYQDYFSKESAYLKTEIKKQKEEQENLRAKKSALEESLRTHNTPDQGESASVLELQKLEAKMSELYRLKDTTERKLGRVEGMIEALGRRETREASKTVSITREEAEFFIKEMREYLEEARSMDMLDSVMPMIDRMGDILNRFAQNFQEERVEDTSHEELESLQKTQTELIHEIEKIGSEQKDLRATIDTLKGSIASEMDSLRDKEQEKFSLKIKIQEIISALSIIEVRLEGLAREEEDFQNAMGEAEALVGFNLGLLGDEVTEVNKTEQENLRRQIERIKIKLEDSGLSGEGEVRKAYDEAVARDAFLTRELADLESSIKSLDVLIEDLKSKIDSEFEDGVRKINHEFKELFSLMFGGGEGKLSIIEIKKRKSSITDEESDESEEVEVEEEDSVIERGLEIGVSLPHKKVRELQALSGGERSLTSIALLFAMSQVNPPPFLILDETDAALDEANSRKYGDMLERLSKHSQLIVVTHNRETMSRAGILYGVTIGSDGASKLLSVKFDEAQAIAK